MLVSCERRDKTSDCSGIRDRHTCLTTTESRDIKVSNVQLKGSVCGWCPNGPCTGNIANQCEPSIWLEANSVTRFETCYTGMNLNCLFIILPLKY